MNLLMISCMFMTFLTISMWNVAVTLTCFPELQFLQRTTCSVGITWDNHITLGARRDVTLTSVCYCSWLFHHWGSDHIKQTQLTQVSPYQQSWLRFPSIWCMLFNTTMSAGLHPFSFTVCHSMQLNSWPIIPSLFSWFCNLTWSLDSSLGQRFWANLSFCGGAGVKIHFKNSDLWRWIPWWLQTFFEV